MNKKIKNFKTFLSEVEHKCSIISLSETWISDESFSSNSNFQLPDYNSFHFGRKEKLGGGIVVFVKKTCYKKLEMIYLIQKTKVSFYQLKLLTKRKKYNYKHLLQPTCFQSKTLQKTLCNVF